MGITNYLPCGCEIDSEGGRDYCPKCVSELNKPMSEQDELLTEIKKVLDRLNEDGRYDEAVIDTDAHEILAKAKRIGWEDGYQAGQQHSIGTDAKLTEEALRQERERIIQFLETFGINDRTYPSMWQALRLEEG